MKLYLEGGAVELAEGGMQAIDGHAKAQCEPVCASCLSEVSAESLARMHVQWQAAQNLQEQRYGGCCRGFDFCIREVDP
jgi:hypothetical protein